MLPHHQLLDQPCRWLVITWSRYDEPFYRLSSQDSRQVFPNGPPVLGLRQILGSCSLLVPKQYLYNLPCAWFLRQYLGV